MNSHILTYLASARQHLQQFASQETDPATLIQLAEAHAALNRARELWQAGAVSISETSSSDQPKVIRVDDGRESYLIYVASIEDGIVWDCRCHQTLRSYKGMCAHIIAARLLCVDEAHREELRQRRERRRRLAAAESVYLDAVAQREITRAAYRVAEEHEAQTFAYYRHLGEQVQLDEQNAAQEQAMTAQISSMEVAA